MIRRYYPKYGASAIQMALFPDMSLDAIRGIAKKHGIRSEKPHAKGKGLPEGMKVIKEKPVKPACPMNQAFRAWGGVVEPGALSWLP